MKFKLLFAVLAACLAVAAAAHSPGSEAAQRPCDGSFADGLVNVDIRKSTHNKPGEKELDIQIVEDQDSFYNVILVFVDQEGKPGKSGVFLLKHFHQQDGGQGGLGGAHGINLGHHGHEDDDELDTDEDMDEKYHVAEMRGGAGFHRGGAAGYRRGGAVGGYRRGGAVGGYRRGGFVAGGSSGGGTVMTGGPVYATPGYGTYPTSTTTPYATTGGGVYAGGYRRGGFVAGGSRGGFAAGGGSRGFAAGGARRGGGFRRR